MNDLGNLHSLKLPLQLWLRISSDGALHSELGGDDAARIDLGITKASPCGPCAIPRAQTA